MEFLVEIDVQWPPHGDPKHRDQLIAAEGARAKELIAEGKIKRLWRQPGRWSNFGLWEVADSDELHAAIASLPFFPWLKVVVRPLAAHPSDPALASPAANRRRRRR